MEIRRIREDERRLTDHLSSLAFMHGQRRQPWPDDPNDPDQVAFGVWDDEGFQAQVVILGFSSHMGSEVMPMGGIAGVACMPAARGRGYVRAAMVRALEHMREAGQAISTLFPFSFDYYRQLGWEWVGVERRYSVASQALKPAAETEACRPARVNDRPAIVDAYRRFSRRYRGMLDRDERQWNKLLDDSPDRYTSTYVYEHSGRIEGYLTYSGGSGDCTDLEEFICLKPGARRGLLGLLRRMNMQTRRFAWSAPDDDGLWSDLCHHSTDSRIAPVTQARVVDVAAALGSWKPRADAAGAFRVHIADEQAPWNDGVWQVEFTGEGIGVRKTDDEPQIHMDIQAFSQAFFGSPNADALRANERLAVEDETAFSALAACLDGPPMWMNDHF